MSKRLTRREWSASLAGAVTVPAFSQDETKSGSKRLLEQARQLNEARRQALAAFPVGRFVEPAFRFEA